MTSSMPIINGSVASRRRTKFTPKNIRLITYLVGQGRRREEIAQALGVTPGTLAVTCSKLKVSLRRPRASPGAATHAIGERRRATPKRQGSHHHRTEAVQIKAATDADDMRSATLAIQMTSKGATRTMELPIPGEIIGQLAIEAEVRDMKLPELLSKLLISTVERGLFPLVVDDGAAGEVSHVPL